MYVSPVDHETYFLLDMREIAVMDAGMQTVFLHIFEELAERHRDQLLCEANVGFIMATSMEVDQASGGQQLYASITTRHVIILTFLKEGCAQTEPSDGDNSLQLPAPKKLKTEHGFGSGQSSSVKHIFNYVRGGDGYHAPLMSVYSKHPPTGVNRMDQLD